MEKTYEPNSLIFKIQANEKRNEDMYREQLRFLNGLKKKKRVQQEQEQSL